MPMPSKTHLLCDGRRSRVAAQNVVVRHGTRRTPRLARRAPRATLIAIVSADENDIAHKGLREQIKPPLAIASFALSSCFIIRPSAFASAFPILEPLRDA